MGRIIEGVWDCAFCGSTKIRGAIRSCPVCGRQRDNHTKFYIDNPTNYVPKEECEHISKNPDWLCSYCDALNSDDSQNCYNCGASKEESRRNYFENLEKRKQFSELAMRQDSGSNVSQDNQVSNHQQDPPAMLVDESVHSKCNRESFTPVVEQKREKPASRPQTVTRDRSATRNTSSNQKLSGGWLKRIGAISLSVLLIACLILAMIPKVEVVTVQGFSWDRAIVVEESVVVSESGWILPANARLKYSQEEIQSYVQVLDHYETKTETYYEEELVGYTSVVTGYRDLGNGYFEEIVSNVPEYKQVQKTREVQVPVYRDDPVYATKYYYDIDRWVYAYTSKSSGLDKEPYWNELELEDKQREGERSEQYRACVATDNNKVKEYVFEYDDWVNMNMGQTIKIKVSIFGSAEIVD